MMQTIFASGYCCLIRQRSLTYAEQKSLWARASISARAFSDVRAASAIAVSGGAVEVRASLMSDGAKAFLDKYGIKSTAKEMTPQIINRKKTGQCPFEEKVKSTDKVDEMISLIRELQSEFAKKNAAKSK